MSATQKRFLIAAALVAGAAVAAAIEYWPRHAPPPPPADGGLSLRGKWIGPAASEDAAAFAGLCDGMADALEVDGKDRSPRVTSGVQLEDLRVAASEGRFSPKPLRERQPHVRAAVGRYLDDSVGKSGGPLDAESRGRWVAAFRELARAARESIR